MKRKHAKRCDLFCGGGGASTGGDIAYREAGYTWDGYAINHWDVSVGTYNANHACMKALCMGVEEAVPSKLFPGRKIDHLWASPTCTHFSRARGGRPRDDQQRAQPFLIVDWLVNCIVIRLTVENVPEFVKWGRLNMQGKPIKKEEGMLFHQWIETIKSCGYDVEWRIVNCADYGDATTRKRFFLKAVRKGCGKIHWPEPTHAENPQPDLWGHTLRKWRSIGECLDKRDIGRSIFGRDRPLAKNTLRRIAVGLKKYNGIEFQMDMLGADKGDGSRVRPLTDPLPPQHAGGNRTAVVRPFIVKLNNHADAEDIEKPLTSVLAGGQHHALCTPFIVRANKGCYAESVDAPLSSQQASTVHHALCQPIIIDHFRNGDATDGSKPLGAQTTHDRYSVVTPFIVEHRKNGSAKPLDAPIGVQTTKDKFSVCTPYIVNNNAPTALDEPIHSQTTGNHAMLCTPLVLGQQSGAAARPADKPCPTIACGGAVRVATPMILDMSRPGGHDSGHVRSADEPIPTITSCDAVQVATPVFIEGVDVSRLPRLPDGRYLDIRIRMLKPSELAAAHSFPEGYVFKGTRTEQVKQIGNSVPVRTAAAMFAADLQGAA